jgi:hypothetical protein
MEVNKNPDIVVMDRRMADLLLHYAAIGASEAGDDIAPLERHVRRFNAPVSADYQKEQDAKRALYKQQQQAVKDLLRTHAGETVYMHLNKYVLAPVKLLSVSKGNKIAVRVYDQFTNRFDDEVPMDRIVAELPADYRAHEYGCWKGRWVHNSKNVDCG